MVALARRPMAMANTAILLAVLSGGFDAADASCATRTRHFQQHTGQGRHDSLMLSVDQLQGISASEAGGASAAAEM